MYYSARRRRGFSGLIDRLLDFRHKVRLLTLIGLAALLVVPSPFARVFAATSGVVNVTVRAQGRLGSEQFKLVSGEQISPTRTASKTTTDYVFNMIVGDKLQVQFLNDANVGGASRDLRIDYVIVGDKVYQSEADNTYSVGSWSASNGCGAGNKNSEWLHCNGYFEYAITQATGGFNISELLNNPSLAGLINDKISAAIANIPDCGENQFLVKEAGVIKCKSPTATEDKDSLADLKASCQDGEIIKYVSSSFNCDIDKINESPLIVYDADDKKLGVFIRYLYDANNFRSGALIYDRSTNKTISLSQTNQSRGDDSDNQKLQEIRYTEPDCKGIAFAVVFSHKSWGEPLEHIFSYSDKLSTFLGKKYFIYSSMHPEGGLNSFSYHNGETCNNSIGVREQYPRQIIDYTGSIPEDIKYPLVVK